MRRRYLVLLFASASLVTGCVIFEDDGYYDDPPILLTTRVSAGATPAFARVDAFLTHTAPPFIEGDEPLYTPAMLEQDLLPTAKTAIGRMWHRNLWVGPATTDVSFVTEWSYYDDYLLRRGMILVGFATESAHGRETVTGGVLATPRFHEDRAELAVTLFAAGAPEVWGRPPSAAATDQSKQCLRRTTGEQTLYLVRVDDTDCDGVVDGDDCQPRAYCDPRAASERGRAACRCDPSFARPWRAR